MQVNCPNCPWQGKAKEKATDRWVLCPKCKNKFLVRGTGLIVVPEKPPQVIKIPSPKSAENESLPPHLQKIADDLARQIEQKRQQQKSQPEIELEIEPDPIVQDPSVIYQGERIRMHDDGRVTYSGWRNRDEAMSLQNEVKLAIEQVKLAMRMLKEEQRKTNATHTIRNRAIGPSLFRYSNKKNTASLLYMVQLAAKAFASVDTAINSNELEKRRALISMVQFNLEAIELELRKYLQLSR